MQYRLAAKVHHVHQDLIIEVVVVLKGEFKPAWRRAVELAVVAKLRDFLEGFLFKVAMTSVL